MPYYRGDVYKPYDQNEDQEMWVGEIDFTPMDKDDPGGIKHEGCVEVRADDESLLVKRIGILIDALNDKVDEATIRIKNG